MVLYLFPYQKIFLAVPRKNFFIPYNEKNFFLLTVTLFMSNLGTTSYFVNFRFDYPRAEALPCCKNVRHLL